MTSQLPKDWRICLVDDIKANSKSAIAIGPFGSRMKSDVYTDRGVPVIRGNNISNTKSFTGDFVYVSAQTATLLSSSNVYTGDLVFPHRGLIGKVGIVTEPHGHYILSTSLMKLTPNRDVVDPLFLFYYFRSGRGRYELLKNASQVGTPGIATPLASLRAAEVVLPPLDEQRAISQMLKVLDEKIELNRRMNQTLESLAKAIFQRSIGGNARAALAEGWRWDKVGDVLSVIETGGRPRGGVSEIREGVPSVGAESIVGIGQFDYAKTKFVPLEFFRSMNKGHVQDWDVLLYKDGGRPGEFEPHITIVGDGFPFSEFSINEHVYRLRAEPTLPQSFLYFWLSSDSAMDEMRNRGTGVAIPGLNSTQVRELLILHPPPDVVTKFDSFVTPLIRRIFANCNESRTLSELRDTLSPQLLCGDIRVPIRLHKEIISA